MMSWAAFVTQETTSSHPRAHLTHKPGIASQAPMLSKGTFPVSMKHSSWTFSYERPAPFLPCLDLIPYSPDSMQSGSSLASKAFPLSALSLVS